mmetsp:Transcript_40945/g.47038  ORF Transcript_40945/g.47038 Transcript_40945/m.47038 type:complete len:114 (-) Transcript_40945:288-629(-)
MFGALYLFQIIKFIDFVLEISIIIFVVCLFVLLFLLIITVKFSGQPYKNDEYKQKIRTLLFVVVVWSLLKIVRAGFGFTRKEDSNFIRRVLEGLSFQSGDKWGSFQFIVIFLV